MDSWKIWLYSHFKLYIISIWINIDGLLSKLCQYKYVHKAVSTETNPCFTFTLAHRALEQHGNVTSSQPAKSKTCHMQWYMRQGRQPKEKDGNRIIHRILHFDKVRLICRETISFLLLRLYLTMSRNSWAFCNSLHHGTAHSGSQSSRQK